MNKKFIFLIILGILLVNLIYALEFRTVYNPFTGKLDYHITGNFTGENITADYFFGNGSELTDLTHSLDDAYDDGYVIQVDDTDLVFNITDKNIVFDFIGISTSGFFLRDDGVTIVQFYPSGIPIGKMSIQSISWGPLSDASYNLGSSALDLRWRHLYLSGNLDDGTISLTVANAKDAYDYSQIGHLELTGGNITGNLNVTGNLTLGQKITFAFGEAIDNIKDGWIKITGSLNVTGNLKVEGDANITGLIYGNGSQLTDLTESQITDLTHTVNESTRFNALVVTDCVAGTLVIGIQANGTVLCATDVGGDGEGIWTNVSGTATFVGDANVTGDIYSNSYQVISYQRTVNTKNVTMTAVI